MEQREVLGRRLLAAEKTIAALMRRVEEKVASGDSAFAALEQNITLERVVAEKTRELEERSRDLEAAIVRLRLTQTELMQAQKLEAVGRLASGIAHEINTPTQFVSDNVRFVKDSFQGLLSLIGRYRQLRECAPGVDPRVLEELDAAEEATDLAYLMVNIPDALESSLEGLSRVASIVRAMKAFAHPEEKEQALADLNSALETTLTIARNEYKYVAEIQTDFGEIPPVLCHVGELNQAFLNIVVNAAHAIEESLRGSGQKGLIRVETRHEGLQVRVSISDNGAGISPHIRDRIFDPFFTTKEVGKGTGQGLAIARNVIVDKHGGGLTFESEVARGTTFHIHLPVEGTTGARSGEVAASAP